MYTPVGCQYWPQNEIAEYVPKLSVLTGGLYLPSKLFTYINEGTVLTTLMNIENNC